MAIGDGAHASLLAQLAPAPNFFGSTARKSLAQIEREVAQESAVLQTAQSAENAFESSELARVEQSAQGEATRDTVVNVGQALRKDVKEANAGLMDMVKKSGEATTEAIVAKVNKHNSGQHEQIFDAIRVLGTNDEIMSKQIADLATSVNGLTKTVENLAKTQSGQKPE